MNIRTMALMGGTMAVAFASVVVACSSSGSGNPSSGSSSGGSSSGTSSSGSSSGTTSSGSSSGTIEDGGTGVDACTKKPPATHASTAEGGIYCPFSFPPDGGAVQYCANSTEQCCLSPASDAGTSACVAFADNSTGFTQNSGCGSLGTGFSIWQCGAPADCTAAGPVLPLADGGAGTASDAGPIVCCLLGGPLSPDYDSCSNIESTHFGGTSCQPQALCQGSIPVISKGSTYTDPLYTVCVTSADCPNLSGPQTCTPIYTTGTPIGVCVPQ